MRILVTGANGFVGKNLIAELNNRGYKDIYEFTRERDKKTLYRFTRDCEFVFHLAGVNRPRKEEEFMECNFGFTSELLELLEKHNNKAPVLITSSIQAEKDNPYGRSKKAGEDLLFKYSRKTGANVFIYRLPNLFGKWSQPNYNSVVATFCHNLARGIEIHIDDPQKHISLSYIDDVVDEFINTMEEIPNIGKSFCRVSKVYDTNLGNLASLIRSFKDSRGNLFIPDLGDELTKKLYSTYLSYLPEDGFLYQLKMHIDDRGSFTEFLKSTERGQLSINISKPGITKGNHWHHTKNEKFLVVSGEALIKFRRIDSDKIIEYRVSAQKLELVDIPTGYTHNITNIGDIDLVTIMWANEVFDPEKPDTYALEV